MGLSATGRNFSEVVQHTKVRQKNTSDIIIFCRLTNLYRCIITLCLSWAVCLKCWNHCLTEVHASQEKNVFQLQHSGLRPGVSFIKQCVGLILKVYARTQAVNGVCKRIYRFIVMFTL